MTAFFLYESDLRRRLKLKRPEEALPLERKWALPAPPFIPEFKRERPPPEETIDPAGP